MEDFCSFSLFPPLTSFKIVQSENVFYRLKTMLQSDGFSEQHFVMLMKNL